MLVKIGSFAVMNPFYYTPILAGEGFATLKVQGRLMQRRAYSWLFAYMLSTYAIMHLPIGLCTYDMLILDATLPSGVYTLKHL